jgi:hypothetical protein
MVLLKPLQNTTFAVRIGVAALDFVDAITSRLPTALVSAVSSVAGTIGMIISKGIKVGVTALPYGLAAAGGVVAGTQIAGRLGVGGLNSPEEAMQRLVQILAAVISTVILALEYLGREDLVHVKPSGNIRKTIVPSRQEQLETRENADPSQQYIESNMGDAPVCYTCGQITIRSGSCYKCLNCGTSLGCS